MFESSMYYVGSYKLLVNKIHLSTYPLSQSHNAVSQPCVHSTTVTVVVLQEAERESIELQESLNGLQEEKERLLNSLVEAEYVSNKHHILTVVLCSQP